MIFRAKLLSRIFTGFAVLLLALLIQSPAAASAPRQEGYPPPGPESGGVPAVEPAQQPATPDAYPAMGTDLDTLTPMPIGAQNNGQAPADTVNNGVGLSQQTTVEASSRGLVFMWLGFIATFLIFLISVVGSILLFTRRNES